MDRAKWINDFKAAVAKFFPELHPTAWRVAGDSSNIASVEIRVPFRFDDIKEMYIECRFEAPKAIRLPRDEEEYCVRIVYGFHRKESEARRREALRTELRRIDPPFPTRIGREGGRVYVTRTGLNPLRFDIPVAEQLETVEDYARAAQALQRWHERNFAGLKVAVDG